MTSATVATGWELRSLLKSAGELELSLHEVAVRPPGADEVVVRVEGAPISPSDLGLLLGPADLTTASLGGSAEAPVLTFRVPPAALPRAKARLDQSMPVGNEGAGTVIAAGSSAHAQSLLGRMVAVVGGAMYTQYVTVKAADCLLLPEGTTAAEGAASFVNPLTALGMVETMRREGHTALVHTAAASNLGQMLNRICLADGIGLVNIVRNEEQAELLRAAGARYVCNSAAPGFLDALTEALFATGATLAFDAVGGGKLAGQILSAMEAAIARTPAPYSRYGSAIRKQVYIYGSLDFGPTEITRNFGMAWGMGGWLLFPFLGTLPLADVQRLRARVVAELKTTFASHYTKVVSLREMLQPENLAVYAQRATGQKFLVDPSKLG